MIYWLWLALKEELRPAVRLALLERFGDPVQIYAKSGDELARQVPLTARQIRALDDHSLDKAHQVLERCDRLGILVLPISDRRYPPCLRQIADPPVLLYVRGQLPDFAQAPGITIVGTRRATPYGLAVSEQFGASLTAAGFTVVSGMALGIDGAAAKGALRAGGRTVAVLAGGVDICYPAAHQRLMGDILLSGAVISENPPGTPSEAFRFPLRNRILSGLSAAVLIVEAPERSGALITARRALDQGREVYVVPGNLDAPASAGCNRLIREGGGALVTSPDDIIGDLSPLLPQNPDAIPKETVRRKAAPAKAKPASAAALWDAIERAPADPAPAPLLVASPADPADLPAGLSKEERAVAQAVGLGAGTTDEIVERTGLAAAKVLSVTTMLEISGVLKREGGRLYLK